MKAPDLAELDKAIAATWPPARSTDFGPFTLRDGAGGGQRTSAATLEGQSSDDEIRAAARAMDDAGQRPLFRVRPGQDAFDAALEHLGYLRHDPTNILAGPLAPVAALDLPRVRAFAIWPPLAVMDELWDAGGIGPGRRAVMARADCAKTGIMGRNNDAPCGTAFVGIRDSVAMVHAVEVATRHRRQKTAQHMMICAARWALDMGAGHLAALCLESNAPSNALFTSVGLVIVGQYHYRIAPN